MSTTTKNPYVQPALIGGAVMGVLSALPIISVGNCCCLWVVSGGVIAAYLFQQNSSTPITPADGAIVGLFAGLSGAVVYVLVSIPIDIIVAPMTQAIVQRLRDMGNMPPEVHDAFERYLNNTAMTGAVVVIGKIVQLMKLKNTLRYLKGEELITHLGREYYD